ncbi:SLATT domain-containing protein [Streptomyces sp. NPDC001139]
MARAGREPLFNTRREVRVLEALVTRRLKIIRAYRIALSFAAAAVLTAVCGTVALWQSSRFFKGDVICGAVVALCAAAILIITDRSLGSRAHLEAELEEEREDLRRLNAHEHPPLSERRLLYREDVAGVIEQYQSESRHYRRVHNALQSVIMIGSAPTTAIAALDTVKELTWQSVLLTSVSFGITLAAAFTGYYKYRERSYFLQQTADDIEKEANAVALGVGTYSDFGPDQEQDALKLFTHRVEELRNEQRRRQQQLDQPNDQPPATTPPA